MNYKTEYNYWVDIISFILFFLMSLSGIIMLNFHSQSVKIDETVFSITGYNWYLIHKTLIVTSTILAIIHLSLHPQWLKNILKGKMFPKNFILKMSFWFLVVYLLNACLSFTSWLIVEDKMIDTVLHGLHSKAGLLLIIIFLIHFIQHFKWIVNTTKSIIHNKNGKQ